MVAQFPHHTGPNCPTNSFCILIRILVDLRHYKFHQFDLIIYTADDREMNDMA